jgi:hypothetical protein
MPEIMDKMAANSISYAHNELILRNQDGGYYTVFYYRQYKIDAHNEIWNDLHVAHVYK